MFDKSSANIELFITGMMCQKNCGKTVENAIRKVPNVVWAEASFSEGKAYVWGTASVFDVRDAVEMVGFEVVSTNILTENEENIKESDDDPPDVVFIVNNMKNQDCSKSIECILLAVDGVLNVVVKFSLKLVYVWGFADIPVMVSALLEAGYNAVDRKQILETQLQHNGNASHRLPVNAISQINNIAINSNNTNESSTSSIADFKITGMSCSSCVGSIEKCLQSFPGVDRVRIALLSEKAEVVFNPSIVTVEVMTSAVANLGYGISTENIRSAGKGQIKRIIMLKITGMSCANCALKIENSLKKLKGVIDVGVSAVTDKAKVSIDDDVIDAVGYRDLIDKVSSLGYGCEAINPNNDGTGNSSDDEYKELRIWGKTLFFALLFGIPVMAIHLTVVNSMSVKKQMQSPAMCQGSISLGQTIMIALNLPLQFGVGYRYYRAAFLGALHGSFGMDFLVVTGTSITFIYNVVQLSLACYSGTPTMHVFFEASGMLLMFVTIGKFLEAYAKGKTVSAITSLTKLQPRQALLVVSAPSISTSNTTSSSHSKLPPKEELKEIEAFLVHKGDVLKVLPGSRIPADGVVISGQSYIDESMITGESAPVLRCEGDLVFGCTVNQHSLLYVRVTSLGSDSALSQIVQLVETAQMEKAPVQAYADRLAGLFTPVVLCLSLATFSVWSCLAYYHQVPREWFQEEYGNPLLFSMLFAISVVVISCPCALGLATPTAIMVGTTVGAANGILFKGGCAFETAQSVTTIIFDKTGTLTEGKPSLTDIIPMELPASAAASSSTTNNNTAFDSHLLIGNGDHHSHSSSLSRTVSQLSMRKDHVLRLAAMAEQCNGHPVARALLQAAEERNIPLSQLGSECFVYVPGKGVTCQAAATGDGVILVGNRLFMEEHRVVMSVRVDASMWDLEVQGKTAVCVAVNQQVVGILGIADVVKGEAISTLIALKSMNIDVWMVTGDNRTTADAVADFVGLPRERVVAGAMPADKVAKVEELQRAGNVVGMVGDGINDSPALARADLGIAIGAGTHIAIDAADMVLVRNNLHDVVVAIDLAKVVFRRVKWNIFWAVGYNLIAIPVAAGAWYPWTHMTVPPQYAGLSMAMSSISVVLSSMSLRWYKRPKLYVLKSSKGGLLSKAMRGVRDLKETVKDKVQSLSKNGRGPRYSKLPREDMDGEELGLELGIGSLRGLKPMRDGFNDFDDDEDSDLNRLI